MTTPGSQATTTTIVMFDLDLAHQLLEKIRNPPATEGIDIRQHAAISRRVKPELRPRVH